MALQPQPPFPDRAHHGWTDLVAPLASCIFAIAASLVVVWVGVKIRNASVVLSDRIRLQKQQARITALEAELREMRSQIAVLGGVRESVRKVMEQQKAKAELSVKVSEVQKNLEKKLKELKAQAKGRDRKRVEGQMEKLKKQTEREVASLRSQQGALDRQIDGAVTSLGKELQVTDVATPAPTGQKAPAALSEPGPTQ